MLTTRFALAAAVTALAAMTTATTHAADMVTTAAAVAPASIAPGGHGTLTITLTFAPGAHVNAHKLPDQNFIPTTFAANGVAGVKVGTAKFPAGVEITTAGMKQVVYDKTTKIVVPFTVAKSAKAGSVQVGGKLTYQACNTAVCFPPKTVTLAAPVTIK